VNNEEDKMSKADDRRALKSLSSSAQRALSVFKGFETVGLVAVPELCLALEQTPLQLFAFSCLGAYRGKEELKLDIWETLFFKRFRKQLGKFLPACAEAGLSMKLSVVLPDTEPVETWGWERSQGSLTDDCRLIAECAEGLPPGCEVVLWSDLLAQTRLGYATAYEWVRQTGPELLIAGEAQHIAKSKAFADIQLNANPRRVAERQVAAYALQGQVLEQLFPRTIFLQSETPAARKDVMYNPLRQHPLPIIHPFTL
jgi:hypothetical protein